MCSSSNINSSRKRKRESQNSNILFPPYNQNFNLAASESWQPNFLVQLFPFSDLSFAYTVRLFFFSMPTSALLLRDENKIKNRDTKTKSNHRYMFACSGRCILYKESNQTDNLIEFEDVSGGGGGTELLTLEKI